MEVIMNQSDVNSCVRSENPIISKEISNQQYLTENKTKLTLAGYEESGETHGSLDYLRTRLSNIRDMYITWCYEQGTKFKADIENRISDYHSLIEKLGAKENVLSDRMADTEEQLAIKKELLTLSRSRSFFVQDLVVLLLNMLAIAGLTYWVAYFYGNCFMLWGATPDSLVDNEGQLSLFTMDHMEMGIHFFAVPLAVAVAVGILDRSNSKWLRIGIPVAYMACDFLFSLAIEGKLVEAYNNLGENYSFSWLNVGLITFMGLTPSLILGMLLLNFKKALVFDRTNQKRAECLTLEEQCDVLKEKLSDLHGELCHVKGEKKALEEETNNLEKRNISTLWYSAHCLSSLYNSYYSGWISYLSGRPDNEDTSMSSHNLAHESRLILDEFLQFLQKAA